VSDPRKLESHLTRNHPVSGGLRHTKMGW
jgi:hypothetical protein